MLDAVLARMDDRLRPWHADGDGRAVFLDCYARMTRAMCRELEAGRFEDPRWVGTLLDRFADHYFDALDAWERHDPATPAPWRLAHDATVRADVTPVQLLLSGVSAHINYDLVLTLVDLLAPAWADLSAEDVDLRRRDYERVNDVIALTADEVQDHVVERHMPWTDLADRGLGPVDEWLAVRLLRSWRTDVWRHATRLLDRDAATRPHAYDRRAAQCERRCRWILLRV